MFAIMDGVSVEFPISKTCKHRECPSKIIIKRTGNITICLPCNHFKIYLDNLIKEMEEAIE